MPDATGELDEVEESVMAFVSDHADLLRPEGDHEPISEALDEWVRGHIERTYNQAFADGEVRGRQAAEEAGSSDAGSADKAMGEPLLHDNWLVLGVWTCPHEVERMLPGREAWGFIHPETGEVRLQRQSDSGGGDPEDLAVALEAAAEAVRKHFALDVAVSPSARGGDDR